MSERIDGMTIKEHIDLSLTMCERNSCTTSMGMATNNMHKSTYRLIQVIKSVEADKTRLEEELATYRDGVVAIYPNETTVEAEDGSLWINIPFEYDYGTYKVLIQEIKNDPQKP